MLTTTDEALYFRVSGRRFAKKYVSLVLLIVQNTALVLLMRYSRSTGDASTRYLSSTAVINAELMKIAISLVMIRASPSSNSAELTWSRAITDVRQELRHRDTLKLAVPGLLYLIQNNLLFLALSNLDAAVYQVTYQLKILTTAMFSVSMLGKSLDREQIFSLVMLTAGVSLVQYAEMMETGDLSKKKVSEDNDPLLGLICVLLACFSSGFAGVYLERVMKKGRAVSIWMRNVQLGLFGFCFGLFALMFSPKDSEIVWRDGFFRGYNSIVLLVIIIQAAGGLLIAAVMQYADNILKGFATSISILLSSMISVWLFSFQITMYFILGAALVITAVYLYGRDRPKPLAEKV
jgi:solute carrier family 35 (UDP-sugar transporter), member A1/2/3